MLLLNSDGLDFADLGGSEGGRGGAGESDNVEGNLTCGGEISELKMRP